MSATTQINKEYIIKVEGKLYLSSPTFAYNVSLTRDRNSAYVFYEEAFIDGFVNEVTLELVKYGFAVEVIEITTKTLVTEQPIIAVDSTILGKTKEIK